MAKNEKTGTGIAITLDMAIPCVFRCNKPYCTIRFYETEILQRHPVMVPRGDIFKYCFEDTIPVYDMTQEECIYFNTRAAAAQSAQFNTEFNMAKFNTKDKLILIYDVLALRNFLIISAACSNGVNALINIGGFVRMSDGIILPYVISTKNGRNRRYVPMFFFEDSNVAMQQEEPVEGYLLPYLKLCCYILGIAKELVKGKICKVVSLDQVKMCSPPHVNFEDVWPMERVMEKIHVVDKNSADLNWLLDSRESRN